MTADESPAISSGVDFSDRVYTVVRLIPHGRVTTFGRIARTLGSPRGARMVGWLLAAVPNELGLPCHRVVNRNGELTGGWHFGHPDIMRGYLLDEEIPFSSDYIVDLARCVWDPWDDPAVEEELTKLEDGKS